MKQKNEELNLITKKLSELEALLNAKNDEKTQLKNKITNCELKLERAKKLIDLLSDENTRWNSEILKYQAQFELLEGNSALCSAALNFIGPFTNDFRSKIFEKLLQKIIDL